MREGTDTAPCLEYIGTEGASLTNARHTQTRAVGAARGPAT